MKRLFLLPILFLGLSSAAFSQETATADNEWVRLFGLSYNFNNTLTFDDVEIYNGSDSYDAEVEFETSDAVGIIFEGRKVAKNSWGFALGAEYVTVRKMKEVDVDVDGVGSGSADVDDDHGFTTFSIYANAIYQWETFYIPFGLSYTRVDYKGDGEIDGGFGANLGLGWQLDQKFYLEFMVKTVNVELEDDSEDIDIGDGSLGATALHLKYNFF